MIPFLEIVFVGVAASSAPGTWRAVSNGLSFVSEAAASLRVLSVLGKIEMHPPDQIPGGVAGLEEVLQGRSVVAQLRVQGCVGDAPQLHQNGHGAAPMIRSHGR
jgi:hypothetical protein